MSSRQSAALGEGIRARSDRPSGPGGARGSARETRLAARSRRLRRRRQNLAVGLLALTWVPGLLGVALGLALLRWWGALGGYTGVSWAIPGLIVGLTVDRALRDRSLPGHRLLGLAAGCASAGVLLYAAASIIGP